MKTTYTTRPRISVERAECARFVFDILVREGLSSEVLGRIQNEYLPKLRAWQAARLANTKAGALVTNARRAAVAAEADFNAKFRSWVVSIDAVHGLSGYAAPRLKSHLGGKSPSEFLTTAMASQMDLLPQLFAHVALDSDLAGEAEKLSALRAASTELKARVDGFEAALGVRANTVRGLVAAGQVHDGTYGDVVRAVKKYDGALVVEIPKFKRESGKRVVDPELQDPPPDEGSPSVDPPGPASPGPASPGPASPGPASPGPASPAPEAPNAETSKPASPEPEPPEPESPSA